MTRKQEIAEIIMRFVENRSEDELEWDDFVSVREKDPAFEAVRLRCAAVREEFPPKDKRDYCSEAGFNELRRIAASLT